MQELTKRQLEIYRFIYNYIKKKKYPPVYREIGECFKIDVKAVHDHLNALQRKGWISKEFKQARSIVCKVDL